MAGSPSNVISAFRIQSGDDQSSAVIGNPKNFWTWSTDDGFDLTHPPSPDCKPVTPRLKLQCHFTPVILDPAKTALLIIDMQNYNLSKALGNNVQSYYTAEDNLIKHAIPAARKAGIQVVWLTWGLTDRDVEVMDPNVVRVFGWHAVKDPEGIVGRPGDEFRHDGERRNANGIGADLGEVTLEDGTKVDGGRSLFKGTWNAQLHDPLHEAFVASATTSRPDVHFHKNRNSGMCDTMTECTEYLQTAGLKTLLFAGVNTDQCVMATIQDANLKGFDTVLLKDGSATNSPEYCQLSAEYNCLRGWGFLSSCKQFADAVGLSTA